MTADHTGMTDIQNWKLGSRSYRKCDSHRRHSRLIRTSLTFRQNLGEPPDFGEGVIERRRRGADDVRFAEIAFHAGSLQLSEQFFRMLVRQDRQLTAPRCCISRRNY